MTKYNFINQKWKNDVIESFQWRPSKCDTVLKCADGQVYLSMISLVVASRFWRNVFSDLGIQTERTVILIPDFNKDTVLQILKFLKKGELTTECCPKIIDFTKVLVPEIEIEKIKNSGTVEDSTNDEDNDNDDDNDNNDDNDNDDDNDNNDDNDADDDNANDEGNENDDDNENDEDNENDDNICNTFEDVEVGKTKEQRHACKFCLKFFVRKTTLERHIRNKHLKTEIYICPTCNKRLESKEGLKAHIKTHDENRGNFVCKTCGKIRIR